VYREVIAEPRGETTVALTGNTFIAQPIRRLTHPRFRQTVEFLRACDITLTNLECAIPAPDTPPAFVAGGGWGATYMMGTPSMIDDLRYMGIDAVCAANNHVSDFGDVGILDTVRHLGSKDMPFAGIGASLTEATQAGYVDSATGLRVAFIVACDWGPRGGQGLNFPWPVGYLPSDDASPFRPRPGVNLLRYETVSHVSTAQLEQLRSMSRELGWEQDKIFRRNGFSRSHPLVGLTTNVGVERDSDTEVWFLGRKFVADDRPGHHTVACEEDLQRLYRHIREARRQADIVCVGLHDQSHGEDVHGYIDTFAHGAIDAGADVYFNNGGSHMGIELYRGKPIIYGLPSLFLQTEAVLNVPSSEMARFGLPAQSTAADFLDARAEAARRAMAEGGHFGRMLESAGGSAVHVCVFDENACVKEIRIQPLEPLGGTIFQAEGPQPVPRFRRQLPLMPEAGNPVAARVLDHAVAASAVHGTEVEIRDGIGVVKMPS
jgi:poly-gamma-glutamate synthesis protein (capsule biosynthesis protein)